MASLKRQKKPILAVIATEDYSMPSSFLGFEVRRYQRHQPLFDVVFVSIDPEVSRHERSKPGAPLVREFGMATLDARRLRCLVLPFIATQSISALHVNVGNQLESP
jgi:hypothetical protein